MVNIKMKKNKILKRNSGINKSSDDWEIEDNKEEVDGPGISQPSETFIVVYMYYTRICEFEKNRNPYDNSTVEKDVTVRIEYLYSEKDINIEYSDIQSISESVKVIDITSRGIPIIKITNSKGNSQSLKPFDIDKSNSEKVN